MCNTVIRSLENALFWLTFDVHLAVSESEIEFPDRCPLIKVSFQVKLTNALSFTVSVRQVVMHVTNDDGYVASGIQVWNWHVHFWRSRKCPLWIHSFKSENTFFFSMYLSTRRIHVDAMLRAVMEALAVKAAVEPTNDGNLFFFLRPSSGQSPLSASKPQVL